MADRKDYLYSTPLGGSLELHSFPPPSSLLIIADFRKSTATCESSMKNPSEGCCFDVNTNSATRFQ